MKTANNSIAKTRNISSESTIMTVKVTNVVFAAHPDDEILGVGGTVAKLSKHEKVYTYIFTYGELSHPWIKSQEIVRKRIEESKRASKIVGSKLKFLGYLEKDILNNYYNTEFKKRLKSRIKAIIRQLNPKRIFVHEPNDPHKIHRFVYDVVYDAILEMNFQGNVYGYSIWNVLPIKLKDEIKIFFDITDELAQKIEAIKQFTSQKLSIFQLSPIIFIKSKFAGWANHVTFAEEFIFIR